VALLSIEHLADSLDKLRVVADDRPSIGTEASVAGGATRHIEATGKIERQSASAVGVKVEASLA
jgi:hypothetical protein